MRLRSVPLLLSLAFVLPAFGESQIRSITLSTAGMALVEAKAGFEPEGLRLDVRRDHIDDFLKSLRVVDPAAAVPQLSVTGPGGLEDVFAGLPFGPEALGDLRALLDAMTGSPVEVQRRGVTIAGRLMGTRDLACAEPGATSCVALTVRTGDGDLVQLLLDEAASVRFSETSDLAAIERGLLALRASATARRLSVSIGSSDATPREVKMAWLQPAPPWKTAWRVEDGADGLMLTGWAVFENTTGQDWTGVELTLATGAVQVLRAQLYERTPVARKLATAPAGPALARAAPMATMELSAAADFAVEPVTMDDGDSFSRFTLGTPVTLATGEVMSLPFLREKLGDARLTLYRGGSGALHPMIALSVENPLPLRLPAGVLTLFEAGRGHAGDAMMPELAPGARELVEFARDTAVKVDEHTHVDQGLHSMRVVDGLLVSEEWQQRNTVYRIQGAEDRARRLTIVHPAAPGWAIQTEGGEQMFDALHFSVDVPVGQLTEFPVVERRLRQSRLALLDLDQAQLLFWQGRTTDAAIRALFEDLQQLRGEEADLRARVRRLQEAELQLVADQQRLVGLIVQLGDDSPATRERRARVDAIETEIEAGRVVIREAQTRLAQITDALRERIRRG